jgi:positive phototaxis protein PixI
MVSEQTFVTASPLEPVAELQTPTAQFLQLYLDADLPVLLPVQQLVEIMTISIEQIVPLFQMPAWVMGVYNWRGEVLWMVDLNHFLGLTPWYRQAHYASKHTIIVLRVGPQNRLAGDEKQAVLGLVVNRVETMVSCNPELIQTPSDQQNLPATIQPFLQGCWQKSIAEVHLILDGAAILQAMPTSHNPTTL